MEYTIYHSDGSFFSTLTCSEESLASMIPEGGFYVKGNQHILSTCINGILVTPNNDQIQTYDNQENLYAFREERNAKLAKSDWTNVLDSPLSDSKKAEWQSYRQILRICLLKKDLIR